jgi:murein DD-endopeptidase MepM/ murein hydrolase activator NlpD
MILALFANVVVAQDVDSLAPKPVADSLVVAADSIKPKADSIPVKRHVPVASVRSLGEVAPIDTLPTTSDELKIILFNDNTWRYVRTKPAEKDESIFKEYWNTSVTHVYYGVTTDKLPESIPIQLIDSITGHHYPYKGYMSSKYGPRNGRSHQGVDLPLKTGDPVYAAFDGKVRYSAFSSSGYGNLVIIRHDNGLETYYAHLSERPVEPNDRVVAGQQIGKGGSTGRSSGPHLHFETRYKGQSFDPERLFDFKTGELRNSEILLKRRHFSIHSKFEQDFNEEEEVAKQEAAERAAASAAKPATAQYHTIVDGDTLGHLAVKYKTTVKKICELNNIEETTILKLGRKLRVK